MHMPKRSLPLPLAALLLGALPAQNCPERNLGIALGGGDEAVFTQPIGFALPFAGTTYTDAHISTNGFLYLSNGGVPAPGAADYTPTPAELSSGSPRICALWNDLNVVTANGASIWIDSTPSRCTITWDQVVNYGMTTPFQLQVQLFPTGEVRIFWSAGATNNSTFNFAAGQGITGCSPGLGAPLAAASDLSVSSSTIDDMVYEHWITQSTFDLAAQRLDLIPTGPGWFWAPTPWSGCATSTDYGTGCITVRDSFYELMAPSAFDLAGTTLTLTRGATGYAATTSIAGSFVPPGTGAVIVANADDTTQTVALAQPMPVPGGTTSQLVVSSNGSIALSSLGNGAGFAPDVGLFLAWAQTSIAGVWHDYNPAIAGSGKIFFEQVGGFAYVTWNDVYSYNSTSPDRFQYRFDLATGNITVVYDSFTGGSANYLVGYSVGGPSPRPEPTDVSNDLATPLALADLGAQGLSLTGFGLPVVGSSSYNYAVSAVPNLVPLAFLFFGDAMLPGLDLTFLGMPGCRGYTNANLGSTSLPIALPAGNGFAPLPIPANVSLVGASLTAQSIAFSLATPATLIASNGTLTTIGL